MKLNAEFMFHGLPVQRNIIDQLGFSDVKGRLYSLTSNLIVGSSIGSGKNAYLIGGGGWYRRTIEAKQTILSVGEICEPWWWWDAQCVNGIITKEVTVGSQTSSAGGFNFGGGLMFQLGESRRLLKSPPIYSGCVIRNRNARRRSATANGDVQLCVVGDSIPADHPLRRVRKLVDAVLAEMSKDFNGLYSEVDGRRLRRNGYCVRCCCRCFIRCAASGC